MSNPFYEPMPNIESADSPEARAAYEHYVNVTMPQMLNYIMAEWYKAIPDETLTWMIKHLCAMAGIEVERCVGIAHEQPELTEEAMSQAAELLMILINAAYHIGKAQNATLPWEVTE